MIVIANVKYLSAQRRHFGASRPKESKIRIIQSFAP
jgi:hypothetical protein